MPVFDLTSEWVNPDNRPAWLATTAIGRFRVPKDAARFDRHHHDDHELWLIVRGKAKVLTDGVEHYVQSGDVVITRAGDPHDILEVYEELEGFFVETGHPSGGRVGHLHDSDEDRSGHRVIPLPLPPDFPARQPS
jgi:mannose-6-phosphate isomerase-like protein (cupin superfamily)